MRRWRRGYVAVGVWAVMLSSAAAGTALANSPLVVPAGGDLQAALDAVPEGGTVLLAPGASFTGGFVIRRAMTLRTDTPLPEARVSPAWSGTLARLASPTNGPALRLAPGVSHVRIDGIEIAPNGHSSGTALEVGSHVETDAARQPTAVVLDRLLVRGHPERGQKRGLSLHGSHIVVRRSHVSDFKLQGQDTQAIWINNGLGPYTIVDNYLEASGENIMAGGDTPRIDQLVPADILIEGNHIAKPLSWKGEPWTVKNLIEFKSGRRITIRHNLLEGSWVSGQVGYGILLTPKDQYGKAPWTTVQDVLIEGNVVRDIAEAIRVLGDDHAYPAVRTERIVIRHNLLIVDRVAHGGNGRCLTVGRAPQHIEFSGNTCLANGPMAIYTYYGGDVRAIMGGIFRRNVFLHNQYGFSGEEATAGGVAALTAHYPDLVFLDNLIGGGAQNRYPGNHVVTVDDFVAQFEDHAGGDFRLTAAARARFPASDEGWLGWDPAFLPGDPPVPPAGTPGETARVALPRDGAAHGTPVPWLPERTVAARTAMTRSGEPVPAAPAVPVRAHRGTGPAATEVVVHAHGYGAPAMPVSRPASAAPAVPHALANSTPPAPTLTLIVHAPIDALDAGSIVTVAVAAAHLAAPLVRVDISVDGVPAGVLTRAPFELSWQVPASASRITATAVDVRGVQHVSAPLDVQVIRP